MTLARSLLIALFVGLLLLIAPGQAQARRGGIILITSGGTVAHVEDVPPQGRALARELTGKEVEVGFAYDYAGLFWLDAWTWDGEFCLYAGDEYWRLDEPTAQAVLGKSLDELDVPLAYRFPPLLVLLLVGGVGYGAWTLIESRRVAQQRAAVMTDPRYTKAAEIFAGGGEDAFEQALDYLETQGIAREYAYGSLEYVLVRRGLA